MTDMKQPSSSVAAFTEALHGEQGALAAWLEANDEREVVAHIEAYARANVAVATAALRAEIERLRAEVERVTCELMDATTRADKLEDELREAREFRDKMVNAIGNDQLRRFIEKHGEPVPLTIRMQEAEARAERLAEALRDAREFVAEALSDERAKFAGYEAVSDIAGIEATLQKIDAALAQENIND